MVSPSFPLPEFADTDSQDADHDWSPVIAAGWVAGDLSAAGLARFSGVRPQEAVTAMNWAEEVGLIERSEGGHYRVVEERLDLIADALSPAESARIHAAAAHHLFASGPDGLRSAVAHARAAGALMRTAETVELAERAGRLSLSVGEHLAAHELLSLAVEIAGDEDPLAQGARLCDLSEAAEALGRIDESRAALGRAVTLGEIANAPGLVARAAVMHALPIDWRTRDARTLGFLARAESLPQTLNAKVAISAARAVAEMRPLATSHRGGERVWRLPVAVAQPLAEEAVANSDQASAEVRCLALLAWRSTHQGPEHLARRRQVSTEALNLAQRLRLPGLQVAAAVWLAVDAVESGDGRGCDEALAVARWVSETDGRTRLRWRAMTLAAGAALWEEDFERAADLRDHIGALTEEILSQISGEASIPGREVIEGCLWGQQLLRTDDLEQMTALVQAGHTGVSDDPMTRAAIGLMCARIGDHAAALAHARWCRERIDPEANFLILATRIAEIAIATGDSDLLHDAVHMLSPWSDHVAVDADGWWCDGPVAVWLAELHHALGEPDLIEGYLAAAEPVARSLNDLRSLRRIEALRNDLRARLQQNFRETHRLTPREMEVLALIVTGLRNVQIAEILGFSLSTIRTDTSLIYRKLQVRSRSEAISLAVSAGLVEIS